MTIEPSAVARVTGVNVEYQDMRGGAVLFLPQVIAVFAQGSSEADYSLDKWQSSGASAGGARYGFGSPAHLILRELQPANGDGVGSIPVWVFPLSNSRGGGSAAEGVLDISGTATRAASYKARIGGVLSEPFVIPKGAVNVSAALGVMANAINAVLEMPVTTTQSYGTPTAAADGDNTGNGTVTTLSVTGSPIPGAWRLVAHTAVANGGVFNLYDALGALVANDVTMTPGVGATTVINKGGIQFTLTDGSNNFAVGDAFTVNVSATDITLTAKWNGESGNAIKVEIIGEDVGVVFATEQLSGGLTSPDLADALDQVGTQWVTMALNTAPVTDEDTLDAFQTFGEGRWGQLQNKPLVVFTGSTEASIDTAIAVPSSRRDDRINALLTAPGSPSLPFVVAARQLARIAKIANDNPPTDYGSQRATGLLAGEDGVQWDYASKQRAVTNGCSTSDVKDGVVSISDVVTFYHPTGEEPPAFRFVKDIVRLQNTVYNYAIEFGKPEWDGAPVIPDDQPTVNPRARKARTVKAASNAIVDSLADWAMLSDPEWTKENTTTQINPQNPNRVDLVVPIKLSGNTNIKSVDIKFGFYYGAAAIVG